ncbi:TIGR02710 family CRISPR-associated CARF protein [Methanobrevibacter oralis]|uniref:CRISPR-associated protein n=1 Tax=Methanobrevibacter oralis TaxID=66851 RepID=A0A166AJ26_METOA|nr:TIGR02710 family CRISPR-associated CARF protein [Methanobrevibacter oralis]KZX12091.1 CRISPR-associated protein [Methanobrevibacter oralis]
MDDRALILSCGGSPEPLIYCIKEYEPDFIYFLCSYNSKGIAEDIVNELSIPEDKYSLKMVKNHESLDESFAKSREIIKELQKNYSQVHIDFTGGTKPLVSGLVLAAIGEKCTYTYVGSIDEKARDKKGLGIVKSGFEKIKEQKDPYDVYAVMEFEKGMEFFDKYQFSAAKTNFIEASKKLESNNLREIAKLYIRIVHIYDKWDKFDNLTDEHKTLNNELSLILNDICNSLNLKNNLNHSFISQIKNNIEFLKLKISKRGKIKPSDAPYYLPDLLNNSLRRIEEGKYDDAVARLYRSIELIAQVKLTDKKIINVHVLESNKQFKIDRRELNSVPNVNFGKLFNIHEYKNSQSSKDKTFKVGLKSSYRILDCLGSSFAKEYLEDEDIGKNLDSRNASILAHGLKTINKKTADNLYNQVFKYAKKAFPELEKYMEMSKFPKFSTD